MITEATLKRLRDTQSPKYPYVKTLVDLAEATWGYNKSTILACASHLCDVDIERVNTKPTNEELRQKAFNEYVTIPKRNREHV